MVVGMAFAVGGIAQFVAGIFEFVAANTFGMTAFCSYGAFWVSIGLMFWPSSGILSAYEADALPDALGLFMITWCVFTFILFLATFRSSAGLVTLFFLLTMTFLLLAVGYFQDANVAIIKAAGCFGILTALTAYYVGAHGLLTAESAPFSIPNPSLATKAKL
ncbi:GPR1/FUN34/yaaH family-domain-containing protein [Kockovaella imperatae]|uniref:GPR1/FUN34/yaaH family-domain-containing protein n=1 Tax=Kockovaella imperatae TaxID=4999 RepID=A0A1Y1UNG4_9TREE|nr:GPR1/FUN34/yaaH family-domain-containing protein [Kockovaella imperatae]ORX38665.1 GPR1/FUN34/yaaH family-domain-containing protein [Kockovaella imperatae]